MNRRIFLSFATSACAAAGSASLALAMPVAGPTLDAAAEIDRIVEAIRAQVLRRLRRRGAIIGLARQKGNQVAISYRRQSFERIKAKNADRLREAVSGGQGEDNNNEP